MELNLSELLRPLQQVRQEPLTIEGRSYLTLALPAPYNLNVQISLQNYKSEIEYICKRKNVPKELQEFIVKNFERNATATGDPISSVKHTTIETSDAKKQLSTITNTNLRTTFKQPVQPNRTIVQRDKQRAKRQTLNLTAQKFKKVTKQLHDGKIDPYSSKQKVQPCKHNPQVFDRLHTQSNCKKNVCREIISSREKQEDEDYKQLRDRPVIDPRSDLLSSRENRDKASKKESIHQKLYRDHLKRDYMTEKRNQEVLKTQKQIQTGPRIDTSSKYLKNYRPFLSRLDEEVQNLRKKKQFLSLSTVDFATNQQLFKPSINRSKAKPRVYDFLNRSAELSTPDEVNLSKVETADVMNRSTEIVRNRQEMYVRSLADKLFSSGRLALDAESIGKLSDREFSLIYPFLSKVEADKSMTRSHFEESFEKFFAKLPIPEKHELKYAAAPDRRVHTRSITSSQSVFPYKPKLNSNSIGMTDEHYYQSVLEFV